MMRMFALGVLAAFGLGVGGVGHAEVKLSSVFGDSMVLQRELAVPVWGKAGPGEKVIVRFAGQEKTATADPLGRWMVRLDPIPANDQGRDLEVSGSNTVRAKDVLVGDVWICSGRTIGERGGGAILGGRSSAPRCGGAPRSVRLTSFHHSRSM